MARITDINPNPIKLGTSIEEYNAFIHGPKSWYGEDPKRLEQQEKLQRAREANKLPLQQASSINAQAVIWAYDNWLPQGELTILAGAPNTGKTAFACTLAAGITNGNGYQLHPDFKANGFGHVIIVNNEDSVSNTLLPRLITAGANLDRVHIIDTKRSTNNETPFSFNNDRDINRLLGLNEKLNHNIGLIIIDPIYLTVDGDHGNNSKARQAFERLAQLAKQLQCAILGIAHTVRNPSGKEPLARVAGTPALREVPRVIILLSKIASGPTVNGGTHVLVHAKNSLGPIDGGFEYCLKEVELADQNANPNTLGKGLQFTITDVKSGSAEEILAEADRPKPVETLTKTKRAEEFLQTILNDGPMLFVDIEEMALKENVAIGTLKLAKSNLKIKTKKQDGDGRSVWSLPDYPIENTIVEPVSDNETQPT
ncbi:AAA family ATPase [Methylomonas rapida]|uniref:AAA family ATPase n=1 Tax=Methylomonas rapida TaxID=2963939 RepID=A0ABY7GJG0_9GAMM|nr:AAA family ATPase [Methylomonas rapida]WAR44605.1 AAA family ATPase [Methylomonas rapida]